MAKLLTASEVLELPDRSIIWMEWKYGTAALKYMITRTIKPTQTHIRIFYDESSNLIFGGKIDRPEYRYWDSEPTLDEREGTPWHTMK